MQKNYGDLLKRAAIKEYFTRFLGIYSRDMEGRAMCVNLKTENTEGGVLYCDKVKVGETLEEAVKRCLEDDFGLKLIAFDEPHHAMDQAQNKDGELTPRIGVIAYVQYGELKNKVVVGHEVEWIERKKHVLYDERQNCEALGWLKDKNDLASNRFSREEAIAFVDNLYKLGAIDVTVDEVDTSDAVAYSDSLSVRLPEDAASRKKLFKIYNEELEREFPDEDPEKDEGQEVIGFWWD